MDKARTGYKDLSLNVWESRRLENEEILVQYLETLQPRWVLEENIKLDKAAYMFDIFLLVELENIIRTKFQPSMFFKVQHDVTGFDLQELDQPTCVEDITPDNFASLDRRELAQRLDIPGQMLENLYFETIENQKTRLEISRHRNKEYSKRRLTKL